MLGRLRHQIGKVGSSTSFSTEHAFPNVSLSAKNLKLFINDSDSKENGNNVSKNTTFSKSIFNEVRYSSLYLRPDSGVLKNIVDLIRKEGGGI